MTDHSLIDKSLKVSQFITSNKDWDIARLTSLVDPVHLQLILATPIPTHSFPDSICWGLSGNGESSTKTATWAACGLNPVNPPVWEYSSIWKLDIMLKLQIFLW